MHGHSVHLPARAILCVSPLINISFKAVKKATDLEATADVNVALKANSPAFCAPLIMQKAQQLAQLGIPQAERVLLPHILDITKALLAGLSWTGAGQEVGVCCPTYALTVSFWGSVWVHDIELFGEICSQLMWCTFFGSFDMQACMRLLRSLFYNMALGKFLDVQAAFGHSGLHAKLVDASLDLLHGPSAAPAQVCQMHAGKTPLMPIGMAHL